MDQCHCSADTSISKQCKSPGMNLCARSCGGTSVFQVLVRCGSAKSNCSEADSVYYESHSNDNFMYQCGNEVFIKKKSQLDGAHFDTIILQQNPSVCISFGRKHDFSSLIFTAHLLFTTSLLLHLLVTSHPSVQTVCSTKQGWTITILIILFDSKTTHFSFIETLQSLVKLM